MSTTNRQMRPLTSVFDGKGLQPMDVHEVGVPARMPPAPVPPPPPPIGNMPRPAAAVSLKPINGEIPQAPKLTHFGAPAHEPTQRKGMIAPNGISAR
jgi:hypothetical protein